MMNKKNIGMLFFLMMAVTLTSCTGVRKTPDGFVAHAESFGILGLAIPEDDLAAAWKQVPKGAKVTNVNSTPADWTSVWGGLNNILGFRTTHIGGTIGEGKCCK